MGVRGLGGDMCHHLSGSFWGYLRSIGHSGAQLFLDVSAAFPSVLRELLHGGEVSDVLLAYVVKNMGFGPQAMHDLVDLIKHGAYMVRCGMSEHLDFVVRDLHSRTWFTTQGVGIPTSTEIGARAGDLLADVAFNFLIVMTHEEVDNRLEGTDICPMLSPLPQQFQKYDRSDQPNQPLALVDDVFADDSAFFVHAHSPYETVRKLAKFTIVVKDVYSQHCLLVNF